MSNLICIKTHNSRIEADLAKSVLEGSGIKAIISADDAGGYRPELALQRGARLLVREEDVERALDVLEHPDEE